MKNLSIKNNIYKWLFAVSILLCLGTGFLFFKLLSIPFGLLFKMSFYLFIGSILFLFLLLTILCFKASKRWIAALGILPLLIFIIITFITVIISIDFRMLYFKGLPPKPTKEEWIEDLHYLAKQMKEKHPNLYSQVTEEYYRKIVDEIESNIPKMSDIQITMELCRLCALPNDAHTIPLIFMPCFDLHDYPIKIFGFEDGWYIVDAGRSYRHLIGTKILKIGSTNMNDIFHRFPSYLAAESNTALLERFTYIALASEWLKSQGIIHDIRRTEFTLQKTNGEQLTVTIPSVRFLYKFYWSTLSKIDNQLSPAFANPRKDFYWFELLDENKTLYLQFNMVRNQLGRETIAEFSERLLNFVNTNSFERFVIDIRNNYGGNDRYLRELLTVIRDSKKINQQGKLFVLIGRRTFSSAVLFAHKLQLQTKAIFIGEPTAQGSIFCANPDFVELPNSRLMFMISTTSTSRTQASWPFNTGMEIAPDIPIQYTHNDFMEGRDPVLEAALSYLPSESTLISLPEKILDAYTGRYLLSPVHVMDVERHGTSLTFRINDFIPGSLFWVQSDLYPISERDFKTDISNVSVSFPSQSDGTVPFLVLSWVGQKKVLQRAPNNFVHAMELFSTDLEKGIQLILEDKKIYLTHYPNLENVLNSMGYTYLRSNKMDEAIEIFRLNVQLFPDSWNVYDSLGEALLMKGNKDLAIENYKKSLELNPKNNNAKEILENISSKKQNE